MDENILTLNQAAEYLHLTKRKLSDLARKNEIPNKKVGQNRLFLTSELIEWLKNKSA